MRPPKLSRWKCFGPWLSVALIMGVAVAIRWRANFSGLMPGVNGTYYPVQVRSLLRDGRLGFPDFPFIFYLEAAVARLLFFLKAGSLGDCIMLASKAVDAVFPTLAAIPVFLLAKAWLSEEKRRSWMPFLAAAFSVLFFSALVMIADFQKNAAGFVWFFSFAYLLYQALNSKSWKNYAAAGVAFVLTGLTHIGCFGLAIVFLFVSAAVSLLFGRLKRRAVFIGIGILVLLLAATAAGLYFFFDPTRVERLIGIFLSPLRVFNPPVIFDIIRGQSILGGPQLFVWAAVQMFGVFGLILLVRRWAVTEVAQRSMVIAAILSVFLLGSPFLNEHWADRLWLMAYGPAVVAVAFLLTKLYNRFALGAVAAFVLLLTTLSAVMMSGDIRPPAITEEAYAELQEIRNVITQPRSTFVAARHGLEWWAAWVLETDAGQEFGLDEESWENYDQVLYLNQHAGAGGYGPGGPGATPFPEVHIPEDAEIIFEGEYFKLARATSMPEWGPRPDKFGPPEGEDAGAGIVQRIEHKLRSGEEVVEVPDPGLELPSGIYPAQVEKYFRLGDIYFALVLQNSLNITLDLSEGETIFFVGVLVGLEEQAEWEKFLRIEDKGGVFKNNPYYLWSEGEEILLTVVDHNGAGSGEGNLKLVVSHLGWDWKVERCYYFGADYKGPQDGDYFEFSKDLSRQTEQSMQNCDNLAITPGY